MGFRVHLSVICFHLATRFLEMAIGVLSVQFGQGNSVATPQNILKIEMCMALKRYIIRCTLTDSIDTHKGVRQLRLCLLFLAMLKFESEDDGGGGCKIGFLMLMGSLIVSGYFHSIICSQSADGSPKIELLALLHACLLGCLLVHLSVGLFPLRLCSFILV